MFFLQNQHKQYNWSMNIITFWSRKIQKENQQFKKKILCSIFIIEIYIGIYYVLVEYF